MPIFPILATRWGSRPRSPFALVLLGFLLLGCRDQTTAPAAVAAITITSSHSELLVGDTHDYVAVALSAAGAALPDRVITWRSDNTTVATITPDGRLTAIGAGTAGLEATSGGRSVRIAIRVTAINPVPVLQALQPATVPATHSSTYELVVHGSGFTPQSVIRWNGVPRLTAFVSATELRMTASSNEADVPGALAITVHTPAPGGGTSAPIQLGIEQPVPIIATLQPSRIVTGWALPLSVTVSGRGFTAASTLYVDGVARPIDTVTPTSLAFRLASDELASPRTIDVRVLNRTPGGGTATSVFSVEAVPVASLQIELPYDVAWTWTGLGLPLKGVARSATNAVLTDRLVTWRIASPAIASLTPTGSDGVFLSGINPGTTSVSATVDQLTTHGVVTVYPRPQFDVLFSGGTLGNRFIARWNTIGTDVPVRLPLGMEAMHPAPSPDGTHIAFVGLRDAQHTELYVARADGSEIRRLTNDLFSDLYPVWSPDGSRIVFNSTRNGGLNIFSIRPDGTELVQLTWANPTEPLPGSGHAAAKPSWSPDGRRLVYSVALSGRSTLWIMDANGSEKRRLTSPVNADDFEPSWSPDGRTIVFRRVGRQPITTTLMRIDAVTGAEVHSTWYASVPQSESPQYSSDGTWLMMSGAAELNPPALFAVPAQAPQQGVRLVLPSFFGGGVRDARWIRRPSAITR